MILNMGHKISDLIVAHRASADVEAADLDHGEWERASAIHITRYWSGEEAPDGRQAEARVLWSERALCVRFDCRQSEPLVVSTLPNIYDDDQLREFAEASDKPDLTPEQLARVAELAATNFGVDEEPMAYKGTMTRDETAAGSGERGARARA